MPESSDQASSQQRRANWVALRTLRQLPKAVGETAGGEPVYEIRSVRLVLDGPAAHFVRLSECSRCGRELTGAPVLTQWDLDHPLGPMTCSDCIGSAGVSAAPGPESSEPAGPRPAAGDAGARSAPREVKPERLDAMEGHLRAVTDRVNELGRVARAHQADVKERSQREEATAAAVREEMAALRASTDDTRAELQRVAEARAELERRWAERPPADEAGAGLVQLRDDVAQLARTVEAQRGELVGFVAAVGETQIGAEGRLARQIASQWGDLETAIEGSVLAHSASFQRANEALASGQAVLEERIDALAERVTEVSGRIEALLDRLAALDTVAGKVPATPARQAPAGSFLDSLDRQLEAAARRLATRSQAGAGGGDQ